jgi:hypothetical protein
MNIGIFASTFRIGRLKLEELIENIPPQQIKRMILPQGQVELEDGTVYQVFSEVDKARGRKFDKAYVDAFIQGRDLNNIIHLLHGNDYEVF